MAEPASEAPPVIAANGSAVMPSPAAETLAEGEATAKAEASAEADEPADFEPIPLRARHDGWTPARQRQFLDELADCGIVKEAARRVGMSRQSAWQLRRRAEDTPFAFVFEAALQAGARRLQSIAFARAVEGVAKPVFYRGQKVGEQRVYDNRLLLALIAKIPAGAAARNIPRVLADWEGWLDAIEQGRTEPAPSIADADTAESPVWPMRTGAGGPAFRHPKALTGSRRATGRKAIIAAPLPRKSAQSSKPRTMTPSPAPPPIAMPSSPPRNDFEGGRGGKLGKLWPRRRNQCRRSEIGL